jgi:prepilin-type N-terminal cleavage/methylation domain-containing protein
LYKIKIKHKAFTLIELLVVVAIIGILAAVGVVAYNGYTGAAKKKVTEANHKVISKYIQNELAKCLIGESKIFDYNGSKQFDCNGIKNSRVYIPSYIEKIFNEKIQDVYEPSTAAMTLGGPIKCHGIPKSYGYKTLGYRGKHSVSINLSYTIIIIETCVEDNGSPLKTEILMEQ